MTKPDSNTLPKFAENDVVDGVSGKNNAIEPTPGEKDSGWIPAGMFPKRNIMNWLHRHTYRWLKWIDEELYQEVNYMRFESTIAAKTHASDINPQQFFNITCIRNMRVINGSIQTGGELIAVSFPYLSETSISISLRVQPVSTWPDWFLVNSFRETAPFIVQDDGNNHVGALLFPHTSSTDLSIITPNSSSVLTSAGYQSSGNKGWTPQTIMLKTPIPPP